MLSQYDGVPAAGTYRPKIQFLTVRSFAPVQPAANFAREFRSFSSDFNADASLSQVPNAAPQ
jgi:hypothetical protein